VAEARIVKFCTQVDYKS